MNEKCCIENCSLNVDYWKDGAGNKRAFKWCQKHRKIQPKKRTILECCQVKLTPEYRGGHPVCSVLGCHRLCIKRKEGKFYKVCWFHGRSYHVHEARKIRKNHSSRMNRYGITTEQYETSLKAQNGTCAICREAQARAVDHDHGSGIVRGILCGRCNAGLGQFRDSPELLRAGALYLEKWKKLFNVK